MNWKISENQILTGSLLIDDQNGNTISRLVGYDYESDEQMNVNAKLIAAAPDLLEVLKDHQFYIEKTLAFIKMKGFDYNDKRLEDAYVKGEEVIKKATS